MNFVNKNDIIMLGDTNTGKSIVGRGITANNLKTDGAIPLPITNIWLLGTRKGAVNCIEFPGVHCHEKHIRPYIDHMNQAMVFYNLDDLTTFDNAEKWINMLMKNKRPMTIYLVGTTLSETLPENTTRKSVYSKFKHVYISLRESFIPQMEKIFLELSGVNDKEKPKSTITYYRK